MRCSVVNNIDFQVMLQKIQIILHPFLAFGLKLFEWIEFYFILSCSYVFRFNVVFFRKFLEPNTGPHEADVSDHWHRVCLIKWKYLHSILLQKLRWRLRCLDIGLRQKYKWVCYINDYIYFFWFEYCLRISEIFLAWVNEPPEEDIVITSAWGWSQNDFLSPVTMESVLF